MFELQGKHNTAKVFTDNIDPATVSQVIEFLNQPYAAESSIRIMPDCHAGAGCVIGTTMTLTDKVCPNLVGVDIGCFTGDTPVWCSSGHYARIKDLAEDATPFMTDCFDETRNVFCEDKAVAKLTRRNAELVAVTYTCHGIHEKDIRVRCTPDHQYLTCLGQTGPMPNYKNKTCQWVEAKDLKPGTQLVAEDNYITVKSVEPLLDREDVYCLSVENIHNFPIEGGVIVHNCGMLAVKIAEKEPFVDMAKLDEVIQKYVPSGFDVHTQLHMFKTPLDCEYLKCFDKKGACINETLAYRSVGTLGGGEVLAPGRINSPA